VIQTMEPIGEERKSSTEPQRGGAAEPGNTV